MCRLFVLFSLSLLTACSYAPMKTVKYVDIDRFMGDWYVIANIPTFIETDAHNAVESYRKNDDGSIDTLFTFRDGSYDGELKRYNPTGYIEDETSNALWGMQFIWPIKADYRVVYLDSDYQVTIIGREARDYVWLMARQPAISDSEYGRLVDFIGELGYDKALIRTVPQNWNDKAGGA